MMKRNDRSRDTSASSILDCLAEDLANTKKYDELNT